MKPVTPPKIIARGPEIRKFQGEPVYAYLLDETGLVFHFNRILTAALYDDDLSFLEALALLPDNEIFTLPGMVYRRASIK